MCCADILPQAYEALHYTYIQDLQGGKTADHGGERRKLVGREVEAREVDLLPPAVIITVVHPHGHGHLLGLVSADLVDAVHFLRHCRRATAVQLSMLHMSKTFIH